MAYTILLNNLCNVSFGAILPCITYFHKLFVKNLFVFFSNDFLQMSQSFADVFAKIRPYLIEKIMFS